jgi:hypothetical protein
MNMNMNKFILGVMIALVIAVVVVSMYSILTYDVDDSRFLILIGKIFTCVGLGCVGLGAIMTLTKVDPKSTTGGGVFSFIRGSKPVNPGDEGQSEEDYNEAKYRNLADTAAEQVMNEAERAMREATILEDKPVVPPKDDPDTAAQQAMGQPAANMYSAVPPEGNPSNTVRRLNLTRESRLSGPTLPYTAGGLYGDQE